MPEKAQLDSGAPEIQSANPQTRSQMLADRVDRLEKAVFGSTYSEHELSDRVRHLEEETHKLGESASLEARISKLEAKIFQDRAFCGSPTQDSSASDSEPTSQALPQNASVPVYLKPESADYDKHYAAHRQDLRRLIHLPDNCPDSWRLSLTSCINRWCQYLPLTLVDDPTKADIDVQWVNNLPPKMLGMTRIESANAAFKSTIYLLRPTFYPPQIPETALRGIFTHQLGQALGMPEPSAKPLKSGQDI